MSRIIIIFIFVVSLSLFAGIEKTNTVETEKLSNAIALIFEFTLLI